MKSIVQVLLALLLIAALVFLMYTQSGDKTESGNSTAESVASHETSSEETAEQDVPEEEVEEDEEVAAYDTITDDVADDGAEEQQKPQKQADKDQSKRVSASLRQRRRNMFKKIDADNKDGIASKEEHDEFFRKAFDFYDKNDDGRLSGKERSQIKRLPRKADANKDGVLTRKEFLDQFERFFVIMDKDESGDLTEKEFVR